MSPNARFQPQRFSGFAKYAEHNADFISLSIPTTGYLLTFVKSADRKLL